MGCLKSKPINQPPKGSFVEPVYKEKSLQPTKKIEDFPPLNAPSYKARLDPRITAKYDFKALIGKGHHTKVFRVENKTTKQPYAVKIFDKIKAGILCDAELEVLRRVTHPNIIQLIEVFESSTKCYLVVELATGGELFERIISKICFSEAVSFSKIITFQTKTHPQDSIKTLKMILEGTSYLHKLGIAHRNLKPENFLYYHPGIDSNLLITDFGHSGFCKEGVTMTTTCGTPHYIAPEILAKQPYTCQVDLWAIGVISFILLSGTMPFEGETRASLFRSIIKADFVFHDENWKEISLGAKEFVGRLLDVDPGKRMTAIQALDHPWLTDPLPSPSNGSKIKFSYKNKSNSNNNQASHHSNHSSTTRASGKSSGQSSKSARSFKSLKTNLTPVLSDEVEKFLQDPEVKAELSSLSSWGKAKSISSSYY